MKDAFGVHKAHHHHYTFKRLVKELTSQGASTTYDQSKRKRSKVSKARVPPANVRGNWGTYKYVDGVREAKWSGRSAARSLAQMSSADRDAVKAKALGNKPVNPFQAKANLLVKRKKAFLSPQPTSDKSFDFFSPTPEYARLSRMEIAFQKIRRGKQGKKSSSLSLNTYERTRKRRVSKGMRLKDGARIRFRTKTHKSGAVDIEARGAKKRIDDGGSPTTGIGYLLLRPNKTVSMVHTDEAFRRQKVATRLREHAESKFGPIEDSEFRRPMGEAWSQAYAKSHGGRTLPPNKLEVSKIALQPVYHGTSATGATKLLRYIKSHEPSKSSFKFVTGKPRADGSPGNPSDPRPEGLYTTQYKYKADDYALTGRSPSHGGIEQRTKRGKTLMFNAVGAKPKYRGDGEAIYDPKDLGAPLATHDIKRTRMMRPRFNETVANIEQHDKAMVAARAKGEHLGDPWSPQKTSAETRADRRKAIFGNAMPRTADFGTQY